MRLQRVAVNAPRALSFPAVVPVFTDADGGHRRKLMQAKTDVIRKESVMAEVPHEYLWQSVCFDQANAGTTILACHDGGVGSRR